MQLLMNITNQQKAERFLAVLLHCQLLGLEVLAAEKNSLEMKLPYIEISLATL